MLYPIMTTSRELIDLNGIWNFKLDHGRGFADHDETGETVASGTGPTGQLSIEHVHLWQPLHAYLYTCVVELWKDGRRKYV